MENVNTDGVGLVETDSASGPWVDDCCRTFFEVFIYCLAVPGYYRSQWWRHQLETFSALLAICAGNSPVPGGFPHKGQWRAALICVWINDWVNNREAGGLRRYRAHYDVTVMDHHYCLYYNTNVFHTQYSICQTWQNSLRILPIFFVWLNVDMKSS